MTGFNSMRAGQSFSGNWTLRNNGFDALPGDCRVVYLPQASANMADTQNNQMGAQPRFTRCAISRQEQVAPGETFVVQLDLVAPAQPGFIRSIGNWLIRRNGRLAVHVGCELALPNRMAQRPPAP
ncbi:MAG: hypothetical protein IPK53_09200 [bacterium]|nr:hypothetical protein [bacterium]